MSAAGPNQLIIHQQQWLSVRPVEKSAWPDQTVICARWPAEALSEDVEITIEARDRATACQTWSSLSQAGLFQKPVKLTFPRMLVMDIKIRPSSIEEYRRALSHRVHGKQHITADILHFSASALAEQWAQQSKCVPNFSNTHSTRPARSGAAQAHSFGNV